MPPLTLPIADPPTTAPRSRGFTLVEMVVTLAVLVILSVVALPPLQAFAARNRIQALSSDFVSSLVLARTEAARAGLQVLVLPAAGGVTGNEFGQGWNLYRDNNGDGVQDSGDTLLRTYAAVPSTLKLKGTATLRFSALGYLTPASTATFLLCPVSGPKNGVEVSVPPSGLADVRWISTCT